MTRFLDELLRGLQWVSLALLTGSLAFAFAVLRVWRAPGEVETSALSRCIGLLMVGALGLALTQLGKIVTTTALLTASLGHAPWAAYAGTDQFRAGIVRAFLALALYAAGLRLRARPQQPRHWALVLVLTFGVIASGAWLVHGAARLQERALLMAVTVVHTLAATAWAGAVIQLLALRWLRRRDAPARALWPVAVARFATLGIFAVATLVLTGGVLAWFYVGSWQGLVGSAYGSLVAAKVLLLVVTLGFAALNLGAGRRWLRGQGRAAIELRVPRYVEAEAFLLVSLLFIAAAVAGQPPAVDIPQLTASVSEVAQMFEPKAPRLSSPTHPALLAALSDKSAIVGTEPSATAAAWSDYNHNVAGVFLVATSLAALFGVVFRLRLASYWPLGLVGLSIFLFFRADAETWPLGPVGFWEGTLRDSEVLQHRIGTLLAFSLGVLETRARTSSRPPRWLPFVFPLLCAFGGIVLITHAHTAFEIKNQYLIQSTHLVMGVCAVLLATGRWLELRLVDVDARNSRRAGMAALAAMLLIGTILLFYREPAA